MKPTWLNILRLAYSTSRDKSLGQRAEVLTKLIGSQTPVSRITNSTVSTIVKELKARELSDSTINRYLSIISRVSKVYQRGYNPSYTLFIPWQHEGPGRFEWLKREDEPKLISYLTNKGQNELVLVVQVLISTGMRLGELLTLEPDQVENRWIRLWQTKTDRPRSIPIQEDTAERLRALIVQGLPKAHTIRRGLRDALRACGIRANITPHSLRHTTATRLIQSGVNVMVAQKFLGHNSVRTTQRYVHIEDRDLTDALERMRS